MTTDLKPVTPDLEAFFAEMQTKADALVAHQAACTEAPCERCERRVCVTCATPFQVGDAWPRPTLCPTCQRREQLLWWARPALAEIPAGFAEAELTAPWLSPLVGAPAIVAARAALAAPRVTFLGAAGSGKTSLAVAMFRAALRAAVPDAGMRRQATHLYVSAFALAKARGNAPLGREAPLIERALEAPLVLIDELGGEDARYASAVTEVVYERHAHDRPTWVTTGVTQKELAARYGGGIARRLFEDATVIRLGAKS